MNIPQDLPWRKSRHSATMVECVEIATYRGVVAIRDSKNPNGARLAFRPSEMRALRTRIKRGDI